MRLSLLLLPLLAPALFAQDPYRVELPVDSPESFEVLVEKGGLPQLFRLERRSVRADDFLLLAYRADGSTETLVPPPPATYRGVIDGDPGSVVVASVTPRGLNAHVWSSTGELWQVEPLVGQRGMPRSAHRSVTVKAQAIPCADVLSPLSGASALPAHTPIGPDPFGSPPDCIHEAELAYDADYQYFLRQGGTVAGTLANIEGHTAVVNEFYARDAQIQHRVTTVIVRTSQFYFHNDGGHLLDLFRAEWNSTQSGVPRDMAHLMTDKTNLSGYAGLAYVGVVCNLGFAYGWSVDSSGVVGHELGHNWGAGHCHDTSPCNNMCGACNFIAPNTRDIIIAFRDSRACLEVVGPYVDPVPPYTYPDSATLTKNQLVAEPLILDVRANDDDGNCTSFGIVDFPLVTDEGGHLQQNMHHQLVYTAANPHVGVDAFAYTLRDPSGLESVGQVTVDVPARELEASWPLNEGSGTIANDATGYGHTGTIIGGATWDGSAPGGGGLNFDGADDQVDTNGLGLRGDEVSIAGWLKRNGSQDDLAGILMSRTANTQAGLHFGTGDELRYTWGSDHWGWNSGLVPPHGEWVFVALVIRSDKAVLHMVDGATYSKKTRQADHASQQFAGSISLGVDPDDGNRRFQGALSGWRVYDKALGQNDVLDLAYYGGPAEGPGPRDGGTHVAGSLAWTGSPLAEQYHVFFGSSYEAVRDADINSPEYQGQTTLATFDPGQLQAGQRLFWRVDTEVFPTTLTSDVWQIDVDAGHHWPLDETSGATAMDVGGGVDGTFEGGALLGESGATANTGSAIFLDGDDDLVRIPALDLNDNHCTISAWIRRSGNQDQNAGIVVCSDGQTEAGLQLGFAHELRARWDDNPAMANWNPGLVVPNSQWVFVALVIEPNRATLYLGDAAGTLESATKLFTNDVQAFAGDTLFGEFPSTVFDRAFRGHMDEVRFLPAALQPGQVQALYEADL